MNDDNLVYVIGHRNPDTDTIATALGYAWVMTARDGLNCRAARAGEINPQTAFALKRFGLEAPELLTAAAWRQAWEGTVHAAASRAADEVDARLVAAAGGVRMPRRRLARHLLSPADRRALAARLGEGAVSLYSALEGLEAARQSLADRPLRAGEAERVWVAAVEAAARRQETAWIALEAAWERDRPVWEQEIAAVRRWRRPAWPVVVVGLLLFGAATWLGLILGGYLAVPGPLQGLAAMVWERF